MNKLYHYIDSIYNELGKNYWFITKQTMSDFYMPFFIAQIVETYNSCKKHNETFGAYYSRCFKENEYTLAKFPKQSESENTYRNAIISEFFGLFNRTKSSYDSAVVTDAYKILKKYIRNHTDIDKYRFLVDRQIEKLCLNVNSNSRVYDDVKEVTIFPVMFLYKILLELNNKYGNSRLNYKEFILFLVFAKKYSDWEEMVQLIDIYRNINLDLNYKSKIDKILNDPIIQNIRFDALFGTLKNIKYVTGTSGYYEIKSTYESYGYVKTAIEIFEHSDYINCMDKQKLIKFMQSDRYFIGNLDIFSTIIESEDEKMESTPVKSKIDESIRVKNGENVILYGVPGAGKSWTIKKEYCDDDTKIERLVFHPDYTYSDFVGQILPKLDDNGQVTYVFTPGPFTKILKKAYENPTDKYYLIIEEVNRGNAPAIFGDIFQLLDRNVRSGASEYSITNSDIAREVYNDDNHKVSIPSNLSILGTMNTSDQNVFTLDTAFQRRWSMRLIQNKFPEDGSEDEFAKTPILDTEVTWEKFFTEINSIILNKSIRMTSSEDKRLGTHFVTKDDLIIDKNEDGSGKLTNSAVRHNRKFAEKVLKYLWDDAFKFNKDEIFDLTKVNSLEKVIVKFTSVEGNKRFEEILKQNIYDTLVPKKTN